MWWTTPAELHEIQDNPNGVASQLANIDKMVAKGHLTQAQASVMRAQVQPSAATAPTVVPGNPALTKQLNILDVSHKSGQLSDEKYEELRANALRYLS